MQALYEKLAPRGDFAVLAFPSNQFNQELPTNKKIKANIVSKFHVTFDMFSRQEIRPPIPTVSPCSLAHAPFFFLGGFFFFNVVHD
jgi:hypothetical protein